MGEWQPISTAPKDGTEILAWSVHEGRYVTRWCRFKNGFGARYENWIEPNAGELGPDPAEPTHWAILPAPPEQPHD